MPQSDQLSLLSTMPPKRLEKKESKDPKKPYSVEELNRSIKTLLEGAFPFVWVKGEISNFKSHTSGHFYFSLKDEKAQIKAVMFKGYNSKLSFRPKNGDEVILRGKVSVYEPRGDYQLNVDLMEPVGEGLLKRKYEELKLALQKKGLFDTKKKKKLPLLPERIALITSPTGAAIQDMMKVLNRRAQGIEIIVVPCVVQGERAPRSLLAALQATQKLLNPDVIILGRGGGSIEDLWGFNDETLAQAIFDCPIPIVSAVGHEIDFTIADFVADVRAATPSAAAELVVESRDVLIDRLEQLKKRLLQRVVAVKNESQSNIRGHRGLLIEVIRRVVLSKKHEFKLLDQRLESPENKIEQLYQRFDDLKLRMDQSLKTQFQKTKTQLDNLRQRLVSPERIHKDSLERVHQLFKRLQMSQKHTLQEKKELLSYRASLLNSLSPLGVLGRGYSIAFKGEEVIRSVDQIKPGDMIKVKLSDGSLESQIQNTKKEVSHGDL